MTGRLEGKVAIITGAGTGIGEAVAHKFAKEGAAILAIGLPGDPVEDVARALSADYGARVESYIGDISAEAEAHAAVEQAVSAFGKLDILCNVAGVFLEVAETQDFDIVRFDATLRNNVRSAFLMTRFALPHLRRSRGVIVNTGSEAGEMGEPNNTPYGGAKGFIHAFTRGVAYEQGKYGVRANCVCPGPIDTSWTHKETGPMTEQMEKQTIQGTVLGRRGTPEEMANVFCFLASDEASYVTGALWYADGGTSIAKGGPGEQAQDFVKQEPEGELDLRHSLDGERNKSFDARL